MALEALQKAQDFHDGPAHPKLPLSIVQGLLGSLNRSARPSQDQVLQWMLGNLRKIELAMLRAHYGFLLQLLRNGQVPVSRVVDLIIACTDASVITQPRVDMLVGLYKTDPLPALSRLLQFLRSRCPNQINIPLQGQGSEYDGHLPLCVLAMISYENLDALLEVNQGVWRILHQKRNEADAVHARSLAELWTISMQSQQIFLAFERYVYETVDGFGPIALGVLARFFRYWPKNLLPGTVKIKLLEVIADKIHDDLTIIPKILPHLWYFGPEATELVDYIASCIHSFAAKEVFIDYETRKAEALHHVLQFYLVTGAAPDPETVSILAREPGLLPVCARWSKLTPEIGTTLQGAFSLPHQAMPRIQNLLNFILDDPDSLFCIANSPWLGSAPGRTFRKMLAEHQQVGISQSQELDWFSPETLEPLGLQYDEFCLQIIEDLRSASLDVSAFFEYDEDEEH